MGSIADTLRRELIERVRTLAPAERMALALSLGDEDVARYMRSHDVDEATARATFARSRRHGRVPSPAAGDEV